MEKVLLFFKYAHFFVFLVHKRMDMLVFCRFLSIKKPAPFPEQEKSKKTTNKRMVLRDLIYSYEPLTLGEPFSLGYRIRRLQFIISLATGYLFYYAQDF